MWVTRTSGASRWSGLLPGHQLLTVARSLKKMSALPQAESCQMVEQTLVPASKVISCFPRAKWGSYSRGRYWTIVIHQGVQADNNGWRRKILALLTDCLWGTLSSGLPLPNLPMVQSELLTQSDLWSGGIYYSNMLLHTYTLQVHRLYYPFLIFYMGILPIYLMLTVWIHKSANTSSTLTVSRWVHVVLDTKLLPGRLQWPYVKKHSLSDTWSNCECQGPHPN